MCLFASYVRLIVIFGHLSVYYKTTNVVDKVFSCLKEYQVMESIFKSIAIGVFVGLAGALFLYIFSEYISEQNEVLVFSFLQV